MRGFSNVWDLVQLSRTRSQLEASGCLRRKHMNRLSDTKLSCLHKVKQGLEYDKIFSSVI